MMDNEKWQNYLHRLPYEYSDRGPGVKADFISEDHALPICSINQRVFDDCNAVVDLGCGVGRAMSLLKSKSKTVRGITWNVLEVQDGIAKYGLTDEEIIVGDLHETPYPSCFFDGAIMWDALEHAISPIIALWECNRILRQGGTLLLFLPHQIYTDYDVHVVNLNVGQTKALLTKTGFIITDIVDYSGESARYVAKKIPKVDVQLKEHNKNFPLRSWTELVRDGK